MTRHKYDNHKVSDDTEILILGTFNPETNHESDFFYGRPRNYLWSLLPGVYGIDSLKYQDLNTKKEFMRNKNIDFIDLIREVYVEEGQENNVDDEYIDNRVVEWYEIIDLIDNLPNLKKVFFTRMTFQSIPNIRNRIRNIRDYCVEKNIYFSCLETPSRYENEKKLNSWRNIIINNDENEFERCNENLN